MVLERTHQEEESTRKTHDMIVINNSIKAKKLAGYICDNLTGMLLTKAELLYDIVDP
jgi:hypothetical protein